MAESEQLFCVVELSGNSAEVDGVENIYGPYTEREAEIKWLRLRSTARRMDDFQILPLQRASLH